MNVHTRHLVRMFSRQLDELAKQFPNPHLLGAEQEQRDEMNQIENRLLNAIDCHTPNDEPKKLAVAFIKRMFQQGRGELEDNRNDFDHTTGHVLAYVFLAIEEQFKRTSGVNAQLSLDAQQNGVRLLVDVLAQIRFDGGLGCDTRAIQELLQLASTPFTDFAAQNRHLIGTEPLSLTAEQVREVALQAAQNALRELVQRNPAMAELARQDDTDDTALREAFKTQLSTTLREEQPGITQEHLNHFLDQEVFATAALQNSDVRISVWKTFKEMALE